MRRCGALLLWPVAAGTLVVTGFLLGEYLGVARDPGAQAAARAGSASRPAASPAPSAPSARPGAGERRISRYTTRFKPGEPRVRNIEIAARILDGRTVRPGATFSFNRAVGPRTRSRGYVPAPAIVGTRLRKDVGGGICQVSTTLFNAVFQAGLDIRRVRAHSLYMPEYPQGREAAVAYPGLDFTWRNDSGHPVVIRTSYTRSTLTVSLWGRRRFDVRSRSSGRYAFAPHGAGTGRGHRCVPMAGRRGFAIDVWRTLLEDGRPVRRERFHTRYQPQPRVECA